MEKQKEPIDYAANFRKRMYELMKELGLNQQGLAEKVGVRRQTISMYEKGLASPKLEGVAAIANALGVSCDYLLGLTDIRAVDPNVQTVAAKYGLSEVALTTLKTMVFVDRDQTTTENILFETPNGKEINIPKKSPLNALNAILSDAPTCIGVLGAISSILSVLPPSPNHHIYVEGIELDEEKIRGICEIALHNRLEELRKKLSDEKNGANGKCNN